LIKPKERKLVEKGEKRLTYKRHSNRIKAKSPKRILEWCGCDRALVGINQKCPVCGIVNGNKKKRFKKHIDFDTISVV